METLFANKARERCGVIYCAPVAAIKVNLLHFHMASLVGDRKVINITKAKYLWIAFACIFNGPAAMNFILCLGSLSMNHNYISPFRLAQRRIRFINAWSEINRDFYPYQCVSRDWIKFSHRSSPLEWISVRSGRQCDNQLQVGASSSEFTWVGVWDNGLFAEWQFVFGHANGPLETPPRPDPTFF